MEKPVFRASQAFFYGLVGDFEGGGGDSTVVVAEAKAVVAPDEGCAARAAACRDPRLAFAGLGRFAGFGREPVLSGRGC